MLQRVHDAAIEDETSVGVTAREYRYKESKKCCDIFRDVVHVGDALRDGREHE